MVVSPMELAHWETAITVVFKDVVMIRLLKSGFVVRASGLFKQLRRLLLIVSRR